MVLIGLALAARLARDTRTYETAIVVVVVIAAAAGFGRDSRANAFARLAAWDKRQNARELRRKPKAAAKAKGVKPALGNDGIAGWSSNAERTVASPIADALTVRAEPRVRSA